MECTKQKKEKKSYLFSHDLFIYYFKIIFVIRADKEVEKRVEEKKHSLLFSLTLLPMMRKKKKIREKIGCFLPRDVISFFFSQSESGLHNIIVKKIISKKIIMTRQNITRYYEKRFLSPSIGEIHLAIFIATTKKNKYLYIYIQAHRKCLLVVEIMYAPCVKCVI
jgi:hypothetical protein